MDRKRSAEWVLQHWAASDGVQSTTRYRPKPAKPAKRTATSRRGLASSGRRVKGTDARSGIVGRDTGRGTVLGSSIGQQRTSPSYSQSVEVVMQTPHSHRMLYATPHERPDQAILSGLHHQHWQKEDWPSPEVHDYLSQQH